MPPAGVPLTPRQHHCPMDREVTVTTTTLQARALTPTFTVNDIKKSMQFYKSLGFAVAEEWKLEGDLRGVMLEAGGASMGLSQDDFSKGRDRIKGVGMRPNLETDQDVEAIARQAKAAGIKLDQEPGPLPWGPIGFSVTDPDGFKLTISKPE